MKRLLYYLGIIDLVWTRDFDGTVRLRIVWHKDGKRYAYGVCGPIIGYDAPNELLPDGRIGSGRASYVAGWYPYQQKPKNPKKGFSMFLFSVRSQIKEDDSWEDILP